ncbi:hypothetical protein [Pseudaminobacter soli (ex Li et al. 2025)]|uniref:Uncharacterized protein n=1 Tax=Pseudaminobacter soli (ex Li et al. 2025) TaxID=1295366 RepID=A0A2P7SDI1_9HYPH|nr:hypothetical protein [Mesorhizobium soli]PSJ60415.1 hypothetical protein C7I85_14855 [Mesorhizobium soli]
MIDEVRANFERLLDEARHDAQYIIAPKGKYKLTYQSSAKVSLDEILDAEGPLTPDDIKDI